MNIPTTSHAQRRSAYVIRFSAIRPSITAPLPKSIWLTACFLWLATLFSTQVLADQRISTMGFESQWGTGWQSEMTMDLPAKWQRIGTEGDGRPVFVLSETSALDLRKKTIRFQARINSIDFLSGVELRFSADASFSDYYAFPMPLYTVKSFNLLQPNTWHSLSFSLGNARIEGSPKADAIRYLGIYLQDNALAPIIFDYTDIEIRPANFPAQLSYTFDDGYDDHLIAAQIMAKHGHAGTAYVIPELIGMQGYLTAAQLKDMQAMGWGISAHHVTPFVDFDPPALNREIQAVLTYLQRDGYADSMRHLAYPLGQQNRSHVLPLTRKAFDTARLAGGGMETLPPGDRWLMRTYNVMPSTSLDTLREQVRNAKANNQWLILMFHYIVDQPKNELEFSQQQFEKVVKMIATEGIEVKPVHEVYRLFQP